MYTFNQVLYPKWSLLLDTIEKMQIFKTDVFIFIMQSQVMIVYVSRIDWFDIQYYNALTLVYYQTITWRLNIPFLGYDLIIIAYLKVIIRTTVRVIHCCSHRT